MQSFITSNFANNVASVAWVVMHKSTLSHKFPERRQSCVWLVFWIAMDALFYKMFVEKFMNWWPSLSGYLKCSLRDLCEDKTVYIFWQWDWYRSHMSRLQSCMIRCYVGLVAWWYVTPHTSVIRNYRLIAESLGWQSLRWACPERQEFSYTFGLNKRHGPSSIFGWKSLWRWRFR